MMLDVKSFQLQSFLPLPYEEVLAPRLKRAHEKLQSGSGAGGEFTGWGHLPRDYDREEFARIQAAASRIRANSQALVVIGIGGSYLGARGVIDCLRSPNYNLKRKDTPNIYFVGNGLSSDAMGEVLDLVADVDFSVNVISKSGTTTEPAVAFRFFREALEKKYGREGARERIYATTDKARGALKSLADSEGWETFVVPDDVGGRYSVLTAVGLLPIAVAVIDIRALMQGAARMQEVCTAGDMEQNPAWQYAGARYQLYRTGKKIEILASYEPSFRFMSEWWKQLYGESEGKDQRGIFPAAVDLTTDLHSMGQFIQDGARIMFETVLNVEESPAEIVLQKEDVDTDGMNYLAGKTVDFVNKSAMNGTILAHTDGSVPNLMVKIPAQDAYSLGQLFYFFFIVCRDLVGDDRPRHGIEGRQRFFLFPVDLSHILIELGNLVIEFLEIVDRLVLVPADRLRDHFHLFFICTDLRTDAKSLFQHVHVAHLGHISHRHIDSAENKDRRHINSNEIHGPSLRDQKIRAAGNRKKTDQDRHKKCQKILKCPRKVKCVVIISPAEARNMIGLK